MYFPVGGSQWKFTCSNSTLEAPMKSVKSVLIFIEATARNISDFGKKCDAGRFDDFLYGKF